MIINKEKRNIVLIMLKVILSIALNIGLCLGMSLNLPIMTCTYLAEIFSFLFYITLGVTSIKIAPMKKDIFTFCLLMPMTVQQCMSVSYDAVLIPICFFLTAYIFYLYYSNHQVSWKELSLLAILSFVILIGLF